MTNQEILEALNTQIEGHERAKKSLITLINKSKARHRQKWHLNKSEDELISTGKLLLIGASGTGKSFLVHKLSKIMKFPFIHLDATHLSPTGAHGGISAKDLISRIKFSASEAVKNEPSLYWSEKRAIDQTVVFIDEICKLGYSFESSGNWNKHTLSNFLNLIDNKDEFAGITWVFAGAFAELYKNKNNKKSIGFFPETNIINNDICDADVVKYGLIPEFVGRLTDIVTLDIFGEQEYNKILHTQLLPIKIKEIEALGGIYTPITKDMKDKIIKNVCKSEMGVRALKRELDSYYNDYLFECEVKKEKKNVTMTEEEIELFNYGMSKY